MTFYREGVPEVMNIENLWVCKQDVKSVFQK